jgi:hypothetical protein
MENGISEVGDMTVQYDIKPILPNTDGRIESLPRPAVKLGRRLCQLASEGDGLHKIQLAFIHGEWFLTVNGGKLERLGKD